VRGYVQSEISITVAICDSSRKNGGKVSTIFEVLHRDYKKKGHFIHVAGRDEIKQGSAGKLRRNLHIDLGANLVGEQKF